jgi:hypothetical protein
VLLPCASQTIADVQECCRARRPDGQCRGLSLVALPNCPTRWTGTIASTGTEVFGSGAPNPVPRLGGVSSTPGAAPREPRRESPTLDGQAHHDRIHSRAPIRRATLRRISRRQGSRAAGRGWRSKATAVPGARDLSAQDRLARSVEPPLHSGEGQWRSRVRRPRFERITPSESGIVAYAVPASDAVVSTISPIVVLRPIAMFTVTAVFGWLTSARPSSCPLWTLRGPASVGERAADRAVVTPGLSTLSSESGPTASRSRACP